MSTNTFLPINFAYADNNCLLLTMDEAEVSLQTIWEAMVLNKVEMTTHFDSKVETVPKILGEPTSGAGTPTEPLMKITFDESTERVQTLEEGNACTAG